MIRAVLFDLDGTLLPLNQDRFVEAYMKSMASVMARRGYDPSALVKCMWQGVSRMVANDGSRTNDAVFYDCFTEFFGKERLLADKSFMEDYYKNEFQAVKDICGCDIRANECVKLLLERKIISVLATNPLFPAVATYSRAKWAGLDTDDFSLITTFENSRYCKPNLDYYREIFEKIDCAPSECLMVGNDVGEDMAAQKLGCKVFLLTDNMINKANEDITKYPNGDFDALIKFLDKITG